MNSREQSPQRKRKFDFDQTERKPVSKSQIEREDSLSSVLAQLRKLSNREIDSEELVNNRDITLNHNFMSSINNSLKSLMVFFQNLARKVEHKDNNAVLAEEPGPSKRSDATSDRTIYVLDGYASAKKPSKSDGKDFMVFDTASKKMEMTNQGDEHEYLPVFRPIKVPSNMKTADIERTFGSFYWSNEDWTDHSRLKGNEVEDNFKTVAPSSLLKDGKESTLAKLRENMFQPFRGRMGDNRSLS